MTLKEIAEELNVSPSTVSRVLNGCNKNFTVKPEVRARILEHVQKNGYTPNRIFRSLRSKESNLISFLFYDRDLLRYPTPVAEAVDVISREMPKHNYTFNFTPCESVRNIYYPLPEWRVAALVIPDVIYPRQLREIEEAGIPYVVLNGICGKSGSAVMSDENANMRMVMELLHSLGHRKIGYLDGFQPGNHHHSFNDRKRSYADFCDEYELEQFQSEPWKYEPLETQFSELLKQHITAVICYNDDIAQQVLYFSWRRGIQIPNQLSVITFNATPAQEFTIPPLDSLAVPGAEMGHETVRILTEKLKHPDDYRGCSIRIPGKLIRRESVTYARNAG
ncbi:LacI family DNA-binding transcriptional regulator [uncultured Victivallis sp.]|uniref:LacI family DNA-binding transcriptional regulator n=1 Tax=uncultured Victivallis sp. TaxID=354118 RepID=UPI0025F9AE9E|nr:LacI family DNA-binding transcriptional regulator [uncultured Victivallis sp.]